MYSVLELCSEMLCSEADREASLRQYKGNMPHFTILDRWRVKIDWISMLWGRACLTHAPVALGTWGTDSSETSGHNWLVTRSDDLLLPQGILAADELELDYGMHITRSFELPTTLAYGEGDLAHKLHNLHHQLLLRTGGGKRLEQCRWSRVACITDQGTEKGLVDAPYFDDPAQLMAEMRATTVSSGSPQAPEKYLSLVCWDIRGPCTFAGMLSGRQLKPVHCGNG